MRAGEGLGREERGSEVDYSMCVEKGEGGEGERRRGGKVSTSPTGPSPNSMSNAQQLSPFEPDLSQFLND